MGYFGIPFRNGVPIGLGSIVGFGAPQEFSPSELFLGGTAGAWYDPSDLTTLFTTSAGTTQCAMPGGGSAVVVGRMLDKSGNGNHAIAFNDTTARPELRARVNLLTYSEEFDNGVWSKSGLNAFGSGSVANTTATLDPLGGNTADFIQENNALAEHSVSQTASNVGVNYIFTCYAKGGGRAFVRLKYFDSANNRYGAVFDLSTGVATNDPNTGSGVIVSSAALSAGNGWWRLTITGNAPTIAGATFAISMATSATTTNQPSVSYTGDGTSGIYIWGADLRPANIGANVPAYQRIADANTYDTSGFPLYLRFDGIDDSMYTPANLDLSGTDKVAVFAGVRKNDNTNVNQLVEFSSDVTANVGAFSMPTNPSATGQWATYLRGSAGFVSASATGTTAPITTVNTGLYDIALSADEVRLRINGTQVATSGASSAGTGNFGSYPLFIGSRNNTTLYFNGNIYSFLVVGNAVSAGNISATEQWVANKTGITI